MADGSPKTVGNSMLLGLSNRAEMGTLMLSWQAYVINLASAQRRWSSMQSRLDAAAIAYERVDAIRGKDLPLPFPDFDEVWHRRMTGRRPIPAEIGCYLSHIKAIEMFFQTEHTHGLFLEDDAVFSGKLGTVVEEALQYESLWDVLRLSTVNSDRVIPLIRLNASSRLGVSPLRSKGAAAYMLNRRAAAKFCQKLLPMRMAYDIAFDLEFLWGLRAMAVTPYPVVPDAAAPTQIQVAINSYKYGPGRYLTVFPVRVALETSRLFCRLGLIGRLLAQPRRKASCSVSA